MGDVVEDCKCLEVSPLPLLEVKLADLFIPSDGHFMFDPDATPRYEVVGCIQCPKCSRTVTGRTPPQIDMRDPQLSPDMVAICVGELVDQLNSKWRARVFDTNNS